MEETQDQVQQLLGELETKLSEGKPVKEIRPLIQRLHVLGAGPESIKLYERFKSGN